MATTRKTAKKRVTGKRRAVKKKTAKRASVVGEEHQPASPSQPALMRRRVRGRIVPVAAVLERAD